MTYDVTIEIIVCSHYATENYQYVCIPLYERPFKEFMYFQNEIDIMHRMFSKIGINLLAAHFFYFTFGNILPDPPLSHGWNIADTYGVNPQNNQSINQSIPDPILFPFKNIQKTN